MSKSLFPSIWRLTVKKKSDHAFSNEIPFQLLGRKPNKRWGRSQGRVSEAGPPAWPTSVTRVRCPTGSPAVNFCSYADSQTSSEATNTLNWQVVMGNCPGHRLWHAFWQNLQMAMALYLYCPNATSRPQRSIEKQAETDTTYSNLHGCLYRHSTGGGGGE